MSPLCFVCVISEVDVCRASLVGGQGRVHPSESRLPKPGSPTSFDGETIALLDISKHNGKPLLDALERSLHAAFPKARFARHSKRTFSRQMDEDCRRAVCACRCVITALAD